MKRMFQSKPTIGPARPYLPDETIRVESRGLYIEVEVPIPTYKHNGLPQAYAVLFLIPGESESMVLANPAEGIHEFIENVKKEDTYVSAFRRKWPLFNELVVDDHQMVAEIKKRPILIRLKDPDDGLSKWMVGRQIAVPPRTSNGILDVELEALQSLMEPTARLTLELQDALTSVMTAFVKGEVDFPKTRYEKFMQTYENIKQAADAIDDARKLLQMGGH